jgi:hypothetical protein
MKRRIALALLLLPFVTGAFAADAPGANGDLKVGFSQVDITPLKGSMITGPAHPISEGIDDPLFSKAMVVQSGGHSLAIVGLDLVKIRRDLADEAIAQAAQRTGLSRDAIILCPSHNHSSPFIPMGGPVNKDYLAALPGHIADSIEQAQKALQPAHMFLGRSLVLEGHTNRRLVAKADGLVLNTWLKDLNNLEKTPQILGTEGPIDPELWLARFDSLDGQVLGTLVNFTCHPCLHDRIQLKTFSADFPGVIADQLAQAYGKQAVCVFTQGCSGNIQPPVSFTPDWKERSTVFAKAAVEAAKRAVPVKEPVIVNSLRRDVEVPMRKADDQREGAIARLGWKPEMFEAAKREAAGMPPTRKVPVGAMRIGPLGIGTNAGELFVEWGISVKQRSPFPYTFVSELTNDWVGYEPTAQAREHEGYETLVGVDFVTIEGIQTLVDTSVQLLQELWKEHPP